MNHHTPGPWIVDGSSIKDESDNTIAQVHWRRNEEQEAANANLIAAAPDMYETLKALMLARNATQTFSAYDKARQVIAQAEGYCVVNMDELDKIKPPRY